MFVCIFLDLVVKYNFKWLLIDIVKVVSYVRDDEFNVILSKLCDDILGGKCLLC